MADFGLAPSTFTVAEYCGMLSRGEVIVNREYQRSDKVWPPAAQSFLIETLLLGYPIPKLSLHQVTDLKTKKTIKEIVDGQQRTRAIRAFFDGELRLSRTLALDDAAGRSYKDLPQELQAAFLNYPISMDIFTGASSEQIREVFRRINSYTVPLNPEEQRHAVYQGEMKWFIYALSRDYGEAFLKIGTFTQGSLVRMADAKLLAEIIHALLLGISTTKKQQLDALYRDHEKIVIRKGDIEKRTSDGIDLVLRMKELHNGPLMKPHMMYSLLLALMHTARPVAVFQRVVHLKAGRRVSPARAESVLSELSQALDDAEPSDDYREFIAASEEKTNVREQRATRFRWFVKALRQA